MRTKIASASRFCIVVICDNNEFLLAYFIVKVATGIVNTYGPPGRPIFFKGHLVLKTLSARGLLKWVLVAFFACAGLLNIFATAPLLAEYRQWGYPWWFHYATGLLPAADLSRPDCFTYYPPTLKVLS
jgi:hypothetical protein